MSKQQKKSTTTTTASTKLKRQRHVLIGAFLVLVALLLFLAIISYFTNWQDDFSTLENFTNPEVCFSVQRNSSCLPIGHVFQDSYRHPYSSA